MRRELKYGENMRGLNKKQAIAAEKLKEIDPESEIFWDSGTKIPSFVKGTLSRPSAESPEEIARRFLEEYRELSDMQPGLDESLELFTVETDFSGFHHVLFLQHVKSIPVFEGSIQIHINPAGEVIAYKDFRVAEIAVSLEPKIKREEALSCLRERCCCCLTGWNPAEKNSKKYSVSGPTKTCSLS
jgi:Zn-dependent metalloprotease